MHAAQAQRAIYQSVFVLHVLVLHYSLFMC